MCGIAGVIAGAGPRRADELGSLILRIAGTVAHRGPDDAGTWVDAEAGVALGHRRLAIIDLSDAGHQPMVSASGRWVLTYNGEIYNFLELRRQLEQRGVRFRGNSDTEVLLAAIDEWGPDEALSQLNGMFAFGLWDRRHRQLRLARDPLGEKPLYYGWAGSDLVFGSELAAIRAHPYCSGAIDRHGLAALLRYKFIPAPRTILQGISKLCAGEMATFDPGAGPSGLQTRLYWDSITRARDAFHRQARRPDSEAVDALEATLRDAVRSRTVADVPIGAFLSGGIDSSTVVALLASDNSDVRTYSIGFEDPQLDEAPHAAAVAKHLGTDHTELYCGEAELLSVIPRLPAIYSEPFADSSQIPTVVVSALARDHVKVVLSGDGGDELFGGYGRYQRAEEMWPALRRPPAILRNMVASALEAIGLRRPASHVPHTWPIPRHLRGRTLGISAAGRARGMGAKTFADFYHHVLSDWSSPSRVVVGDEVGEWSPWPLLDEVPTNRELMMLTDLVTYLPEDILVKVDRASMAVGLETRVPLLDTTVVEHSWRLPLEMKVRDGEDKWILRQVAYRFIPPRLLERPKQGFGPPLGEWLRGTLHEWAADLLAPSALEADGYFRPDVVGRVWRAHQEGHGDWSRWLWSILVFQAWRHHTFTTPLGLGSR